MRHVVINADDLGLHVAVRRAVENAAGHGLTSASVLANGADIANVRPIPGVSLGAHLNVLRGPPLSSPGDVPSLLGPDGLFLGSYKKLYLRYLSGKLNLHHVRQEWRLQIETLLSLGLTLTHADSEKHTHCWPRLMLIAAELADEFNIPWLRRSVERVPLTRWDAGGIRVRLLNAWALAHRAPARCKWPDAVWGIADQGASLLPQRLAAYLEKMPADATIEVVCHPGDRRDDDPPPPTNFGPLRVPALWQPEFDSLTKHNWPQAIEQVGGELVSFADI